MLDAMTRTVEMASRALGRTAPNPPVGAVIIRDGRILGEGVHEAAGAPHAEVMALRSAGEQARGATLYVSLEPCCHHGRTPPCTDAILAAGLAEVRYAVRDPDPRVAGRGHAILADAGVHVVHQPDPEAERLVRGFLTRVGSGRPWVTAKVATSLDGKIATRTGDARWISGPTSRERVHELRNRADAVLVGIGTALSDDPQLTVRPAPADGRQPLRIVLDSTLRLDPAGALASSASRLPTIAACVPQRVAQAPGGSARRTRLADLGVQILDLPGNDQGQVSLPALLEALGRRGLNEVLVEGGGDVIADFLEAGLVDELLTCIAPIVIGGRSAPGAVGGAGIERLAHAPRFAISSVEILAGDLWVTAHPAHPPVAEERAHV